MGNEQDQPARETVQDAELRRGLGEAQAARTAAARRKSMALRLSFADRDTCAAALSKHYGEGRIDGAELERRLTLLFEAETRGDLRPVFEGLVLPRLPTEAPPQLVASRAVVVFSIVLGITLPFAALGTFFLIWGSDDGDRKGGLVVLGIVAIVLVVTWWRTLRRSTIRIWAGW